MAKEHITTLVQNQTQVASSSVTKGIRPRRNIQGTTKAVVHLQSTLKSWGDTSEKLISILKSTARLTDMYPKDFQGIGWDVIRQLEQITHILSAASARPHDPSDDQADLHQYEIPLQRLVGYDDTLLAREGGLHGLRGVFTMDDSSQVIADAFLYDTDEVRQKPALLTERKNQLLRTCSLVSRLSKASPNIAPCVGLVHNESIPAFIFISQPAPSSKPLSHIILTCTSTTIERYQLALQLADAIRTVHKADFVHRNVTSTNVFTTTDYSALQLAGFGTARHDSAQSFRFDYLPWQARVFIAPDYLENGGDRWVKRNDIYGLGVILLEIGLWSCMEAVIKEEEEDPTLLSPEDMRNLLVKHSDRLKESLHGHEMFKERYREVVLWALTNQDDGVRMDKLYEQLEMIIRFLSWPSSAKPDSAH